MAFTDILSLLAFVLVATISPGGATALATASGASFGYLRSLRLIAGIAFGLGTMAAFAALGLSRILIVFPQTQILMKVVGTVYLVWLAVRLVLQSTPGATAGSGEPRGVIAGIGLVWQNPKGWAMTASASAAYVGLAKGPFLLAAMLGFCFSIIAACSLSVWCLAGHAIGKKLKTPLQWRILNGALATVLILSIVPLWSE